MAIRQLPVSQLNNDCSIAKALTFDVFVFVNRKCFLITQHIGQ